MAGYGYQTVEKIGGGIQVLAHGKDVNWKVGGVTVFWGAITAESADRVVTPAGESYTSNFLSSNASPDDYVQAGDKFVRYGTFLCRISGGTADGFFAPYGSTSIGGGTLLKTSGNIYICNQSFRESQEHSDYAPGGVFEGGTVFKYRLLMNLGTTQLITISATGGTFTATYKGQTTSAIAYNAAALAVQTALEALSTIGTGNVTVTGSAGGPYTITLGNALAVPVGTFSTNAASLTGGAGTAVVSTPADSAQGPTQAEVDTAFGTRLRYVAD